MKRKLYYVVDREIEELQEEVFDVSYMKDISVYEIIENNLSKYFTTECHYQDSTEECIQQYLDDNGHSDEEFELIQL